MAIDEPGDRLVFPARGPGPQVDHRPTTVVGEIVADETSARLDDRDRVEDGGAGATPTSSAWRTWKATDGPLRSTKSHDGDPSSTATSRARVSAVATEASQAGSTPTAIPATRPCGANDPRWRP